MGTTVAKLFGEIAVEQGFCTRENIEEALAIQRGAVGKAAPRPLGAILHELGFLSLLDINKIQDAVESAKRRRSIEGFDVLAKLGAGAMSSVYLARQVSLGKLVALKVLPRKVAQNEESLKRFKREALATAKLNHPGIVQAYDIGESNGFHYLVMEYIQGETLRDLLEREKRLPEKQALEHAIAITSALAHAAEHRIVHRDVKPANIMITRSGEPKLCDLGLAVSRREESKITSTGVIMGTPYYLSPEQAKNEQLDERSDLYSLGATLFHAVTGGVPYDGDSPAVIVARHWTDPVPDPRFRVAGLSEDFALLVMRLLAKDPEGRYQSCEELMADLLELKRTGELLPSSKTRAGKMAASDFELSATAHVHALAAAQASAAAQAALFGEDALLPGTQRGTAPSPVPVEVPPELDKTQPLERAVEPEPAPFSLGAAGVAAVFAAGLLLGLALARLLS